MKRYDIRAETGTIEVGGISHGKSAFLEVTEDIHGKWIKASDFEEYKNSIVGHFNMTDIYDYAENEDIELSEEEAKEVMSFLQRNFDAEQGVCWLTINNAINEVKNEK